MGAYKKIFFALIVLAVIVLSSIYNSGNLGFSSASSILGLSVGAVSIYIFLKLIIKALGCLPSLLILFGIIILTLYAIGAFSSGNQGIISNLKDFLEAKDAQNEEGIMLFDEEHSTELHIGENFEYINTKANIEEPENQLQERKQEGTLKKIVNNISNKKSEPSKTNKYPMIYGKVKVLTADTLLIRNHLIRLYGIAAPTQTQTCADSKGHSYTCGKKAARWLQNWLLEGEIECKILQKTSKYLLATCLYGEYDLGAALVISGWAVALPQNEIYAPYEQEAQKNHSGMWSGKFYKPWDWAKIQSQQPNIKVIKPKIKKKRLWDYL